MTTLKSKFCAGVKKDRAVLFRMCCLWKLSLKLQQTQEKHYYNIILDFLSFPQSGEKKKDDETVDSLGKSLVSINAWWDNEAFAVGSSCNSSWVYGFPLNFLDNRCCNVISFILFRFIGLITGCRFSSLRGPLLNWVTRLRNFLWNGEHKHRLGSRHVCDNSDCTLDLALLWWDSLLKASCVTFSSCRTARKRTGEKWSSTRVESWAQQETQGTGTGWIWPLSVSVCMYFLSICVDMQNCMILVNLILFFCRYGVVLRKLDLVKEAIDVFVEAAHVLPLHWGAWLELCNLITDKEMVKLWRYQNLFESISWTQWSYPILW